MQVECKEGEMNADQKNRNPSNNNNVIDIDIDVDVDNDNEREGKEEGISPISNRRAARGVTTCSSSMRSTNQTMEKIELDSSGDEIDRNSKSNSNVEVLHQDEDQQDQIQITSTSKGTKSAQPVQTRTRTRTCSTRLTNDRNRFRNGKRNRSKKMDSKFSTENCIYLLDSDEEEDSLGLKADPARGTGTLAAKPSGGAIKSYTYATSASMKNRNADSETSNGATSNSGARAQNIQQHTRRKRQRVVVRTPKNDVDVNVVSSSPDDHNHSNDYAYALVLQASSDMALAQVLQQEEDEEETESRRREEHNRKDMTLAQFLQHEEDARSRKADPNKEHTDMTENKTGRAVLAVQRIIELVRELKMKYPMYATNIDPVATDDMVYLAERLLERQEEFVQDNIPSHVDIGYHYTNPPNMQAIRTNGMMTKGERKSQRITSSTKHGSVFGDGIYTGNNPKSFRKYGSIGLLVARLQGNTVKVPYTLQHKTIQANTNTVIGDKMLHLSGTHATAGGAVAWPKTDKYHEIVLRSSSQCLPMVKFDGSMTAQAQGRQCIKYFQTSLQVILDELFNRKLGTDGHLGNATVPNFSSENLNTSLAAVLPSSANSVAPIQSRTGMSLNLPIAGVTSKKNTNAFATNIQNQRLKYKAPHCISAGIPSNALIMPPTAAFKGDDDCVICQDSFSNGPCAALSVCNHVFHFNCIQRAFASGKPQCPICRRAVGNPQGKSPSGKMSVSLSKSIRCTSFETFSTIIIKYEMKQSSQRSYHENPGQKQSGKRAKAYLPNNTDGQKLLKRLKFAFLHGLTFTVGTSMTTGAANQCTWSSIHHKTSPTGGNASHGYPDTSYFINCNEELDNVDVPQAHSVRDDGSAT